MGMAELPIQNLDEPVQLPLQAVEGCSSPTGSISLVCAVRDMTEKDFDGCNSSGSGAAGVHALQELEAGFESFEVYFEAPYSFASNNLVRALDGSGVECPKVDRALLKKWIDSITDL